jgi:hypothetical protein
MTGRRRVISVSWIPRSTRRSRRRHRSGEYLKWFAEAAAAYVRRTGLHPIRILAGVREIKSLAWAGFQLPELPPPEDDQTWDDTLASYGIYKRIIRQAPDHMRYDRGRFIPANLMIDT